MIPNSQRVEITQMSINWWMDKQNVVRLYIEYYLAIKRKRSTDTCYSMDELQNYYTQWKDNHTFDSIYIYSHALLNNRDTFWEMHRWAISPRLYGSNLMGPLSYMQSVTDQNITMWHVTGYTSLPHLFIRCLALANTIKKINCNLKNASTKGMQCKFS